MVEAELQYVYRGDLEPVVPAELASLVLSGSEFVSIVDTYVDTSELRLRAHRCSLRIRTVGNHTSSYLTWKGPAEKEGPNGKRRTEVEIPISSIPDGPDELRELLARLGLLELMREETGLDGEPLHSIGALRNDRSIHSYVQGLHRLELSWDRVTYPVGPDELRLELEAKSEFAERYLPEADAQLRRLFSGDLVAPRRGKVRELCRRLYPELVAQ